MELSEILNSLSNSSSQEKTAGHSLSLSDAIDSALGSTTEKTASHSSMDPSADLIKIAQDISNAEQDALVKEAHLYGRAVADGFAARMSHYGQSASVPSISSSVPESAVKEAMELGYLHASSAIARSSGGTVKQASYANAEPVFTKEAAFVKEAAYNQGATDAVKVASYLQGQQNAALVVNSMVKTASSYENFGFKVGNNILKRLAG